MAEQSRIAVLASIIQTRTNEIDEYIKDHDLNQLSFAIDVPATHDIPEKLLRSRDEVLNATEELQALINGPLPTLTRLTSPTVNILMSLQAIYRYKIASYISVEEEVSYEQLSERCGLSTSDTRRFLRLAIANRVFQEPRKGFVSHNAISKLIRELPLVNQWIGLVCDEMWPSGTRAIDAMMKWPGSDEPVHTGFSISSGYEAPFFQTMSETPERAQRFADAMQFLQMAPEFDPKYLIDALQWDDSSCPQTMVDVGGSQGAVGIAILRKFPSITCVVEDLPEIINTSKIPNDLKERLSFREQNFFEQQIVKGADVYFFRSIFHDWCDKYCIKILRNLIPALKNGTKIILNEICLPEPGTLSYYQEQFLRGYDLAMKQNSNGKERDTDEWIELFKQADSRFKFDSVKNCGAQTFLSIIQVIWTI